MVKRVKQQHVLSGGADFRGEFGSVDLPEQQPVRDGSAAQEQQAGFAGAAVVRAQRAGNKQHQPGGSARRMPQGSNSDRTNGLLIS